MGFAEFTISYHLPRHIHMSSDRQPAVDESIMVLSGVGVVELMGHIFTGVGTPWLMQSAVRC